MPNVPPSKSPKRRSTIKRSALTVSDSILKIVSESKESNGVSLAAVKKALQATGYDVARNRVRILSGVRRLVSNKSLVQTKGTGASGSFKLNKTPATPRKKKPGKKKKKAANTPRAKGPAARARAAKNATVCAGNGTIKCAMKKKRKTRSANKAKSPAATKKPRSPRKAPRRITRSRVSVKK